MAFVVTWRYTASVGNKMRPYSFSCAEVLLYVIRFILATPDYSLSLSLPLPLFPWFQALQAPACHENMIKVGGYIMGEFGNLIAGDPQSGWDRGGREEIILRFRYFFTSNSIFREVFFYCFLIPLMVINLPKFTLRHWIHRKFVDVHTYM